MVPPRQRQLIMKSRALSFLFFSFVFFFLSREKKKKGKSLEPTVSDDMDKKTHLWRAGTKRHVEISSRMSRENCTDVGYLFSIANR